MKKSLKTIAGTLTLLCIVSFLPQISNASTWATVSINKIGETVDGNACGYFTDAASTPAVFTNQYLKFKTELSNQMLALVLTALTLDKTLSIRIMDDGYTVDKMYIMK